MRLYTLFCLLALAGINTNLPAQDWAGFDAAEYRDVLLLNFKAIGDTSGKQQYAGKKGSYLRLLRTPEVGLLHRAEVYDRQSDGAVLISLRGTVNQMNSWLANFYSGMVPAQGSMALSPGYTFTYQVAAKPDAYVHIGWLAGAGFLEKEMKPLLDSLLRTGRRKLLIAGHSQGGALTFIMTSLLYYRYKTQYPDLQLKAYASAAPKPGNLYYAYDFDHITRNGYGFRVVNSEDWVPESPFSVQTLPDFNTPNPFSAAGGIIKKQKFPARIALNHAYKKMRNGSEKAMNQFKKYLGNKAGNFAEKALPGFEPPPLTKSFNYSTAGTPVVLMANAAYLRQFTFDGKNYFIHHMYEPYSFLMDTYYPEN